MRTRQSDDGAGWAWVVATVLGWSVLLALLGFLLNGCASTLDKVVSEAKRTPWQDAAYLPVPGDDAVKQYTQLRMAAAALGYPVTEVPEMPEAVKGAAGALSPWGEIFLDSTYDINARVEVLAHELAHTFQPPGMTRAEREVYAELVSLEVQKRLGYKAGAKSSGRYLAGYKMGLYIVDIYKKDIQFAADAIVNAALVAQP